MKLKIEIDMVNDSFMPTPNAELCRVLRELIGVIERHRLRDLGGHKLYDTNGNAVGSVSLIKKYK